MSVFNYSFACIIEWSTDPAIIQNTPLLQAIRKKQLIRKTRKLIPICNTTNNPSEAHKEKKEKKKKKKTQSKTKPKDKKSEENVPKLKLLKKPTNDKSVLSPDSAVFVPSASASSSEFNIAAPEFVPNFLNTTTTIIENKSQTKITQKKKVYYNNKKKKPAS